GTNTVNCMAMDSSGNSNTCSFTVIVYGLAGLNRVSLTMAGGKQLKYIGIPGQSYFFQSADGASGPYSNLSPPLLAAPSGAVQYTDTNSSVSAQFYRAKSNP